MKFTVYISCQLVFDLHEGVEVGKVSPNCVQVYQPRSGQDFCVLWFLLYFFLYNITSASDFEIDELFSYVNRFTHNTTYLAIIVSRLTTSKLVIISFKGSVIAFGSAFQKLSYSSKSFKFMLEYREQKWMLVVGRLNNLSSLKRWQLLSIFFGAKFLAFNKLLKLFWLIDNSLHYPDHAFKVEARLDSVNQNQYWEDSAPGIANIWSCNDHLHECRPVDISELQNRIHQSSSKYRFHISRGEH